MQANNLKTASLLLVLVFSINKLNAQDRVFELKNSLLNIGVGFGWISDFYPDNSQWPTLSLSYEKGLLSFKNVGIVSIGVLGGYHQAYYDYPLSTRYYARWQNVVGAARGALHPYFLMSNHLHCYIGFLAGARYEFFKDTYFDDSPENFVVDPNKRFGGFKTLFAGFVGMRFYPGERLGFFVEGGYGMNYVTIGMNWKFGARNLQADPGIIKRGVTRPRF